MSPKKEIVGRKKNPLRPGDVEKARVTHERALAAATSQLKTHGTESSQYEHLASEIIRHSRVLGKFANGPSSVIETLNDVYRRIRYYEEMAMGDIEIGRRLLEIMPDLMDYRLVLSRCVWGVNTCAAVDRFVRTERPFDL